MADAVSADAFSTDGLVSGSDAHVQASSTVQSPRPFAASSRAFDRTFTITTGKHYYPPTKGVPAGADDEHNNTWEFSMY